MKDLVLAKEILSELKYNIDIKSYNDYEVMVLPGIMGYSPDCNEIVIANGSSNIFNKEEFKAMLLHEIGHSAQPNGLSLHEEELFADTYSVNHGGNAVALITGLIKLKDKYEGRVYIHEDCVTHPSLYARATNLGINLQQLYQLIDNITGDTYDNLTTN